MDPPPHNPLSGFSASPLSSADSQVDWLRAIVDNTVAANALWTPVWNEANELSDFRYLYVNPAAARYLNQPSEALVGKLVSQYTPAFHESGHARLFADAYITGVPLRQTLLHPRLKRWLDMAAARVGDALLLSFHDVHDQHEVTRRAQEQADLLQRVVDQSPAGMMLLEAVRDEQNTIIDFRYTITNGTNARLRGLTVAQMTGQLISTLFPGYQSLDLFKTLTYVTQTGEKLENRFVYDRYGIKGIFDGYYIRQGDGVLFTFIDVTHLVEQQQQLTQMNRELLQSNESLQQFAYIASHDLQEPLRKLQSFSKILNEQYATQLDGTGLDILMRIQSSARRMSDLIRDLLNYARITTQKEDPVSVDLNRIMTDVLTDLDIRIQETQPVIEVARLPIIQGRVTQLRQLFHNLLGNALKFQPTGQRPVIRVTCLTAPPDSLPADLAAHRPYWRIDVGDNGIGFHQQYTDRIFEVFQRLNGKSKFAGTGVGLAVCRRVAETHGGAIQAASQLGEGSTFSVYLPQ